MMTEEKKRKILNMLLAEEFTTVEINALAVLGLQVVALTDKEAQQKIRQLRFDLAKKAIDLEELMNPNARR